MDRGQASAREEILDIQHAHNTRCTRRLELAWESRVRYGRGQAPKQILRGNNTPAANELGAFINKLTAAMISGRLSSNDGRQLTAMAQRIQRVLQS